MCLWYMCQQLYVDMWTTVNYKSIHNFSGKFICEPMTALFENSHNASQISRQAVILLSLAFASLLDKWLSCINKTKRISSTAYLLLALTLDSC